ncbi:hypothetical protein GLOTRDRAFT_93028 [Gloeophyllum trabeum ATCC 11539]|uniref:F-box domain-containing protein n=1 Tax=Gloeophyllum trabeum (strain ATCC 11539 / FP-39264 / Madison 617) TaxID=670483 RepID=S7RTZ5_GLOTA|nr:uncharacterized protein GLOTRDRAFT_93028 [Gloeophyllum trabeum ATCC 11539]EPQ56634.1 hypothetical protein GLOTRDRAFT_93028 [Gloeophyllum trabeum ATCC 11539]
MTNVQPTAIFFPAPTSRYWTRSKAMNFLKVSYDVQAEILQYLLPQELASCSATSKRMHRLCVPFLASGVIIKGEDALSFANQTLAFCRWIQTKKSSEGTVDRCTYLRSLALYNLREVWLQNQPPDESLKAALSMLTEVLAKATNLRHFSVSGFDILLATCPRIKDILSHSCGSLTSICIGETGPGPAILRVLWKLKGVPGIHLRATSGTREQISFMEWLREKKLIIPSMEAGIRKSKVKTCFPRTQELILEGIAIPAALLSYLFPNIRLLIWMEGYSILMPCQWSGPRAALKWDSLDRLMSDFLTVAHRGVFCPVRRLDLCFPRINGSIFKVPVEKFEEYLLETLQRTSPVALSVCLHTQASNGFYERVARACPRLKFLEICLAPNSKFLTPPSGQVFPEVSAADVLPALCKGLASVQIAYMSVLFFSRDFITKDMAASITTGIRSLQFLEVMNFQESMDLRLEKRLVWYEVKSVAGGERCVMEVDENRGKAWREYWQNQ